MITSGFNVGTVEFSVVVPLYNKEQFIERCLKSVTRQSLPEFEAVVVDDGSTDNSLAAARQAVDGDPRFRFITQRNAGVSAARNAGIAAASGKFLALLDGDDEWLPDHLACLSSLHATFPRVDLLCTGYAILRKGVSRFSTLSIAGRDEAVEDLAFFQLWDSIGETPISASSVALRREAIRAIGGFPAHVAMGEDLLTWFHFVERHSTAYANSQTVLVHEDDTKRATRAPGPHTIDSHFCLIAELERLRNVREIPENLIRKHYRIHERFLMNAGRHSEALQFAWTHRAMMDAKTLGLLFLEILRLRSPVQRMRGR